MDLKEIQSLIDLLKETQVTEIEVEEKGRKIRVRKELTVSASTAFHGETVSPPASRPADTPPSLAHDAVKEPDNLVIISSPIVGTFYRTHSPGAEPYVKVGETVKKGQVLCIVEAMKLMNEIDSELDGTLMAICVEDKSPVEFGQPLFKIEPVK